MKEIINLINECRQLSFDDRKAFPVIVKKLTEAGVERYYADLVRLETTYYWGEESFRAELLLKNPETIAEEFSEKGVRDAIHAIQKGEIDYTTFLHQIMQSGSVGYIVYLKGAQVHYLGRKGNLWIEHFPR